MSMIIRKTTTSIVIIYMILFFNFKTIFAQTASETIDYINKLLYKHSHQFPVNRENTTININDRSLSRDFHMDYRYPQFMLSESGELTVNDLKEEHIIPARTKYPDWLYDNPIKTGRIINDGEHSVFIKQLDTLVLVEYFSGKYMGEGYRVTIKCKYGQCWKGKDDNSSGRVLLISGSDNANRFKNALQHFIREAHLNPNYIEKDPFDY